jgi:bifunctional DNA-binding transcriptional regulator/antitoxin component of YhaV-PrlF toxin-antitoxin module
MENTAQIDLQGKITLPKDALELIGLFPNMKVIIEWTKNSIVIKPKARGNGGQQKHVTHPTSCTHYD